MGYRLFASVSIAHDYFESGLAHHLVLRARPATQVFLRRFGLMLRCDGQRMALFVDEARLAGMWSERAGDDGERLLYFALCSTDPDCAYYTDMGIWTSPRVFRPDSASPASLQSDASLPALRSPAGEVGLLGEIVLPLKPADCDGYENWLSGLGRAYRLDLQARSTVWKYLLLGDWPGPDLRLVDVRDEVAFSAPAVERLPDGRAAQVIHSLSAIRLQERPAQRFQLRSGSAATERVLVARMPAASPKGLRHEAVAGVMTTVSEIFINR